MKNIIQEQPIENEEDQKQEKGDELNKQEASQQKNNNKSLLRLEKNYFDDVYHESKFDNYNQFVISKFIKSSDKSNQNKKKPEIKKGETSNSKLQLKLQKMTKLIPIVLERLKQFIPIIKNENEILLNDPQMIKQKQIDNCLVEYKEENDENEILINDPQMIKQKQIDNCLMEQKEEKKENLKRKQQIINLDLYLGVFDVNNADTKEDVKDSAETSQIIKKIKLN